MDDTPPHAGTDGDDSLADLLFGDDEPGTGPTEDPDFLGLEPVTVEEPPSTGWGRRLLVFGVATVAASSVLTTVLIIGTTGDRGAERVAQPVPAPPSRSVAAPPTAPPAAPSPAAPPAAPSPAAPRPGPAPEPDGPTGRAAVSVDAQRDRDEPPKPLPAPERAAPPPPAPPRLDAREAGRAAENLLETAAQRRLDRFREFVDRVDEFWGIDR